MALKLSEQLERVLRPIRNRIASMVVCALVKSVTDSDGLQILKVQMGRDEVKDDVERIQQFGFTSNPPNDSEAIVLFVGGNRSHGICLATDSSTYRIKNLPSGAVVIYNKNGEYVKLTEDTIEIVSGNKVLIDCTEAEIKADTVNVKAGEIKLGDGVMHKALATEDFVTSVYKMHVHPTAPPGIVSVPTPIPMPTELTSKTKAE